MKSVYCWQITSNNTVCSDSRCHTNCVDIKGAHPDSQDVCHLISQWHQLDVVYFPNLDRTIRSFWRCSIVPIDSFLSCWGVSVAWTHQTQLTPVPNGHLLHRLHTHSTGQGSTDGADYTQESQHVFQHGHDRGVKNNIKKKRGKGKETARETKMLHIHDVLVLSYIATREPAH